MIRSERGSALVLTLLFIMLLTTMSTALYLYASKQSMFADSNYTQVAATYVANAGIERGKALLIDQDPLLNTHGKHPTDGVVSRDDFPVILPISQDVGRYDQSAGGDRITDNKQGVGKYSLRIDGAFSEVVDFDLNLQRTVGFDFTNPATLVFGNSSINRVDRLLPGKNLKIQVRQGIEVVNAFEYKATDPDVILDQLSGATEYNPINIANIINPFMGQDITIELNRTPIAPGLDHDHCDAWGNRLMLFPHDYGPNPAATRDSHISTYHTGNDALYFYFRENSGYATYVMHMHNLDPMNQFNIEVVLYYRDPVIGNTSYTLVNNWAATDGHAYALLDFSFDNGACKDFTYNTDHALWPSIDLGNSDISGLIVEVRHNGGAGGGFTTAGLDITVSRGIPGEVDMGLRMRTEGMDSGCWYPDYPDCTHGTNDYEPIITLPEHLDHAEYLLTPDMMRLGHRSRIRVNELYTITSNGNVEDALETRQLMVSPISFLDYARFTQSRLTLAAGGMFAGRVYSQDRIELPAAPDVVFFYDDVLTSSQIINPGSAVFPHGGELIEDVPLIEFPELSSIASFYNSNLADAWVIGSGASHKEYDLFLGNYDYVNTAEEDKFWGLDFSDAIPQYHEPDADIFNSESYSYRDGWVPGDLGPNSQTLPENFNGLIVVNGDVHIWGTLHGRSITVLARGDIYIEREIIMGTDTLITGPLEDAMSSQEGMPVHMNLVPLRRIGGGIYDGDIILSENCPRIMRVEAGLMAFAGALVTEDDDWDPGGAAADQDADNSHPLPYPIQPSATSQEYVWKANSIAPPPGFQYDLNNDGRITDGLDFAIGELPRIELGEWNEKQIVMDDYIWYLMLVGPFIDRDGAAPGHFAARGFAPGSGRNGNTRNYRYDPSIRINAPPFVVMPENTLRIMEWDRAVYDLPN